MKKINVIISLALLAGLFLGCGASGKKDQFINDLVSKMTLEEKVGQMTQVDKRMLDSDEDIATYFIGSFGWSFSWLRSEWQKRPIYQ